MPSPSPSIPLLYHEPDATTTPPPSPPSPATTKWGPYSNSRDFTLNMAIILAALLAALALALAVNALIKYLFCPRSRPQKLPVQHPIARAVQLPETVYERSTDEAAAECAICLSEFVNGDRVRVLPACGHGFHVQCVEKWIDGGGSCPTCRARCDVGHGEGKGKGKVLDGCGV